MTIRVCCYIDGFNVYHAIDDMNRAQRGALRHLKWLNLRALMNCFIDPNVHEVTDVNYFSAYMTWDPKREARHRAYVRALEHFDIKPVMGQFKRKDCYCKLCKSTYSAREFLVTNDSDLLGPIRLFRAKFKTKKLKIIAPPFRVHSKELWAVATHRAKVLQSHLEACELPNTAHAPDGTILFARPQEYEKL